MLNWIKSLCEMKRTKEKSAQPVIPNPSSTAVSLFTPILKAETLLNTAEYQQQLREIKQHISTTPEEFARLYVALIHNVAEFMQQLPDKNSLAEHKQAPKMLLSTSLAQAINALKIRRGYMLPRGADTETCYRQQSSWTYAVFAASLLQDCWHICAGYSVDIFDKQGKWVNRWQSLIEPKLPSGHFYHYTVKNIDPSAQPALDSDLVKALMPVSGFQWLCENDSLMADFLAHLSGISHHTNPLTCILQQAANKNKSENQPDFLSTVTGAEEISGTLKIQESIVAEPHLPNEAMHCHPADRGIDQPITAKDNEGLSEQAEQKEAITTSLVRTTDLTPQVIASQFLQWLEQYMQLTHNIKEENSVLYRVKEGILVLMPQALRLFKENYPETDTITEKVFMRSLASADLLIHDANRKMYMCRYYKGAWQTRDTLQGMLLKPKCVPNINESLSFCTELNPYPF